MELDTIINQYKSSFLAQYGSNLLPEQLQAIHALQRCRTPDSGEIYVQYTQCNEAHWRPMSCGHRSCPKCQNFEASQWLERQQAKLLPVEYFLVTFTLPHQLRVLAWQHQKVIYSLFFACVSSTLKDFGLNPEKLGINMGMTAVLHTHSRKLDYHPHIHLVVPGGGVDKRKKQWKKLKGKYLFNEFALAKVFRARFLEAIVQKGLAIPSKTPDKWIVNCIHAGKGLPALKYLSRYLYRGVISEKNIVANNNGLVTFKYTESKTKKTQLRTLKGEDFLRLVFQHVLPKGFRRVRDYGFLHPNAKKLLLLVQLILNVFIQVISQQERPVFKCPKCQSPMAIITFRRPDKSS
ncbi:MAG: transposase [gamma proteobacterium symbiont of Taylorina sp.]|nr:transposase [gamma proteobacterium symbiont of Taylorina sp.]